MPPPNASSLSTVVVEVVCNQDLIPGPNTNYSYNLSVAAGPAAFISAPSVFGAIYGLETFSQLVFKSDQSGRTLFLPTARVAVLDEPQWSWRGLMVDPGRRFFPMPLMRNLLDTMSYVKLNVLHL